MQHVFITHGHLDHSGAVVSHARLRGLSKGSTGKYYMHAALAAGTEKVGAIKMLSTCYTHEQFQA